MIAYQHGRAWYVDTRFIARSLNRTGTPVHRYGRQEMKYRADFITEWGYLQYLDEYEKSQAQQDEKEPTP